MPNWLLPEYIRDMLPEEARRIEQMRGTLLELMRVHGYQLVAPPLLEYAESLLIHDSPDMDLRTFKLVDQLGGRTLGVRADITPQVARIDAHLLDNSGVARLCYAGSVLHTQPIGLTRTRELLQLGAELYGYAGLEGDLEIQQLMLRALAALGIGEVHLDLGHVGVFRALAEAAGLTEAEEEALFDVLQRKDVTALAQRVAALPVSLRDAMLALPVLYGDSAEVLARARAVLPSIPALQAALDQLEAAARVLQPLVSRIGIDLADLRGYHYHSGMVFAAYHAGCHDAIALGGRYDDLGKSFGRARPATGFSMDLRQLYRLLPAAPATAAIAAPALADAALQARIAALRAGGEVVVVDLADEVRAAGDLGCDRRLVAAGGEWQIAAL